MTVQVTERPGGALAAFRIMGQLSITRRRRRANQKVRAVVGRVRCAAATAMLPACWHKNDDSAFSIASLSTGIGWTRVGRRFVRSAKRPPRKTELYSCSGGDDVLLGEAGGQCPSLEAHPRVQRWWARCARIDRASHSPAISIRVVHERASITPLGPGRSLENCAPFLDERRSTSVPSQRAACVSAHRAFEIERGTP